MSDSQSLHWQALSRDHHLPPFTDYKALNAKGTRIITKASGVYLWDSEGHKILDAMAGLWCVNLGYGREELVEAATRQMRELPYYNLFFQTAHPPAVALAKAIADIAPAGTNHVFFTGSGSEANDTVLRMVRHYWAIKGQPAKKVVIGRWNGYHGSTIAGASLGGMKAMHEQGDGHGHQPLAGLNVAIRALPPQRRKHLAIRTAGRQRLLVIRIAIADGRDFAQQLEAAVAQQGVVGHALGKVGVDRGRRLHVVRRQPAHETHVEDRQGGLYVAPLRLALVEEGADRLLREVAVIAQAEMETI